MWFIDTLLGNDGERSSYTTSVAKLTASQTSMFHGNNSTAIIERCFLCGLFRDVISRTVRESQ
jgi:hypothetical protein